MREYEVSFFRELVNSSGRRYLSKLDTFIVAKSPSIHQAMSRATEEFERAHDVEHWSRIANDREITPLYLRGAG